PGRACDPDDAGARAAANGPAERRHRGEGCLGDEGCSRTATESVLGEVDPAADRDEEIARLDPARVDPHAADLLRAGRSRQPARRQLRDLGQAKRDHVLASFVSGLVAWRNLFFTSEL